MKKVLIIDDHRDLADGMAAVFKYEGFQVDVAYKAGSGLDAINENTYDIVFLDAKLPDFNGISLYQKIHKIKPDLEVALITGYRIDQLLAQFVTDGNVRSMKCASNTDLQRDISVIKSNDISVMQCPDNSKAQEFISMLTDFCSSSGKTFVNVKSDEKNYLEKIKSCDLLIMEPADSLLDMLDLYLKIRQKGMQCSTILLHSSNSRVGDVMSSFSSTKCIFKPFDPLDLVKIVRNAKSIAA